MTMVRLIPGIAHLDDFDPSLVGYQCDEHFLAEVYAMRECGEPPPEWFCPFKSGCDAKEQRDCPAIKQRVAILAASPIFATWGPQ
jgi:hypothetical protein